MQIYALRNPRWRPLATVFCLVLFTLATVAEEVIVIEKVLVLSECERDRKSTGTQ